MGEESHAVTAEKISVYTERSSVGTVLVNINAAFVGSVRALIPFSVLQLDPPVEVGGSCWRSWRCTYRLLSPCQTIHIINPFSLLQTPCAAHTSHFFTLFPPLPGDLNKLLENCIQQSLGNPPFSHKHPLFFTSLYCSTSLEHSFPLHSSSWRHTHTDNTSTLCKLLPFFSCESRDLQDEGAVAICSRNADLGGWHGGRQVCTTVRSAVWCQCVFRVGSLNIRGLN